MKVTCCIFQKNIFEFRSLAFQRNVAASGINVEEATTKKYIYKKELGNSFSFWETRIFPTQVGDLISTSENKSQQATFKQLPKASRCLSLPCWSETASPGRSRSVWRGREPPGLLQSLRGRYWQSEDVPSTLDPVYRQRVIKGSLTGYKGVINRLYRGY